MKKSIILKPSNINRIINKIISENESEGDDDISWVRPDIKRGEELYKQKWRKIERQYHNVDLDNMFDLLIDSNIVEYDKLNDIADELEDIFSNLYDEGRSDGRDDCDCDGCCDDFIWYEEHERLVERARDKGHSDGFDAGSESRDDEVYELEERIKELESKISELEDEIEYLKNNEDNKE